MILRDWIEIKYNVSIGIANQLKTVSAIVLGLAFQDVTQEFYRRESTRTISIEHFVVAICIGIFLLVISSVVEGFLNSSKRAELECLETAKSHGHFR